MLVCLIKGRKRREGGRRSERNRVREEKDREAKKEGRAQFLSSLYNR
jgi:hypothetical protein